MPALTKAEVLNLLDSNPKAVERALVVLYHRQTLEEKHGQRTKQSNGVGFSRYDAPFATKMAEIIIKKQRLTTNQLNASRSLVKKYWGQLISIAEEKEAKKVSHQKPKLEPPDPEKDVQLKISAQIKFCKSKGVEVLIPYSGRCWNPVCLEQMMDRISLEEAGTDVVSNCPFCFRSLE